MEPRPGQPVHDAISWQDTRTDHLVRQPTPSSAPTSSRERPVAATTYFSGPKLRWLLDNVAGLRERAHDGDVMFGTIDSWLIWRLTGRHLTDVTNASRTLMMSLRTLDWDDELLAALDVPRAMLPEIHASAEVYGEARGTLAGVPVAAALGDQQAALFGQACFEPARRSARTGPAASC